MKAMHLRALFLPAFATFALALSANAALTMTLEPDARNAARGTEVVFSGTLTNTSPTDKVFLNDIHATLNGGAAAHVTLQTNDFFANVPGILLPGEAYTGPIFRVALDAAAPAGDYTGTIVIDGGGDIVGSGNLTSALFTVLSPSVNITASDPEAAEFGPDTGTFTITRTGGTTVDLEVPFTFAGTAQNGIAYQAIAPTTTIPASAASATVILTPIPDHLAQGDRLATLSLSASPSFNIGADASASVTIHDTPADAWRLAKFGASANDPAAADLADWDADGLANLIEYSLDLAPKTPDRAAFPLTYQQGGYLYFSYVPNAAAVDIGYSVEASANFGAWSAAEVETVNDPNPVPANRVTVRYRHPISLTDHIFLRLTIVRP